MQQSVSGTVGLGTPQLGECFLGVPLSRTRSSSRTFAELSKFPDSILWTEQRRPESNTRDPLGSHSEKAIVYLNGSEESY